MKLKRIQSIIYENPEEEDKQSQIPTKNNKNSNNILNGIFSPYNAKRSLTTKSIMSKQYKYLSLGDELYQDSTYKTQTDRKFAQFTNSCAECNYQTLFSKSKGKEGTECLNIQLSFCSDNNDDVKQLPEKDKTIKTNNCLDSKDIQLIIKDSKSSNNNNYINDNEM